MTTHPTQQHQAAALLQSVRDEPATAQQPALPVDDYPGGAGALTWAAISLTLLLGGGLVTVGLLTLTGPWGRWALAAGLTFLVLGVAAAGQMGRER